MGEPDLKVALRFVPQNGTRSYLLDDYERPQQNQDYDPKCPLVE